MVSHPPAHLLFAAAPWWGHARPLLALARSLLTQYTDLSITFLATKVFYPHLLADNSRYGTSEDVSRRLRLWPLGQDGLDERDWARQSETFIQDLKIFLSQLSPDATRTDGFGRLPTLAVADLLFSTFPETLTRVAADDSNEFLPIPMLAFAAAPASWCLRRATSDAVGRYKQLWESPEAKGKSRDQLLEDAFTYTEGKLIHLAGTAPMYDYEFQPQLGSVPFNPSLAYGVITAGAQHKNWDGLVNTTSPDLEPGAIEAFAEAAGGICLQVGPQFSESAWDGKVDDPNVSVNEEDQAILSFLDSCEKRFGVNSAIYVSFGTVYSPSRRPDLLLTLINSLLSADPPLPFVFATVTTYDLISEATRTKVAESGLGIITRFAPQQMVLQHRATGWFMTHTGSGGMYESIISKVPMVCWPCMTDQPISAANLSVNWRVAFELLQVRTGPSVGKPTHRGPTVVGSTEAIENEMREVWAAMRGEEGKAVRQRMEALHDLLHRSREDGLAKKGMTGFEQFF